MKDIYWTIPVKLPSGECHNASLMISHHFGSGNGLVPSGTKPMPEPMLTQIFVTIWHGSLGHNGLMWCHRKHLAAVEVMTWMINYIPYKTMGCNYLSIPSPQVNFVSTRGPRKCQVSDRITAKWVSVAQLDKIICQIWGPWSPAARGTHEAETKWKPFCRHFLKAFSGMKIVVVWFKFN